MKKLILIIGLLALPFASQADRDWHQHEQRNYDRQFWHKVDQRLDRQYRRIEKGVMRGELTRWEAKKLHREHHKLDKRIERIRHKHWLGERHKHKIMSHLDRASETIHRLKHNEHYAYRNPKNDWRPHDKRNQISWSSNDRTAGFYMNF